MAVHSLVRAQTETETLAAARSAFTAAAGLTLPSADNCRSARSTVVTQPAYAAFSVPRSALTSARVANENPMALLKDQDRHPSHKIALAIAASQRTQDEVLRAATRVLEEIDCYAGARISGLIQRMASQ